VAELAGRPDRGLPGAPAGRAIPLEERSEGYRMVKAKVDGCMRPVFRP
jgi:hypothetical protein